MTCSRVCARLAKFVKALVGKHPTHHLHSPSPSVKNKMSIHNNISSWAPYTLKTTPKFSLEGTQGWARLLDAHDGDTITIAMEAFPGGVFLMQVRLAGIDTPEISSKDPAIRAAAQRAQSRLLELLGATTVSPRGDGENASREFKKAIKTTLDSSVHLVYVRCDKFDKYGRLLAEIAQGPDAPHVGAILVREGLANSYDGGTKQAWIS